MLNDSGLVYFMFKYGWQFFLEYVYGLGFYLVFFLVYSSFSFYVFDFVVNFGFIIFDIIELVFVSFVVFFGGSIDERFLFSSFLVCVKEEFFSLFQSFWVEEVSFGCLFFVDIFLFLIVFIDFILWESEFIFVFVIVFMDVRGYMDIEGQFFLFLFIFIFEKCFSVVCLDKNEFSDYLDVMDFNLDNLQIMLSSYGFSVDISVLLDLFSFLVIVFDMSLFDFDSSLVSI